MDVVSEKLNIILFIFLYFSNANIYHFVYTSKLTMCTRAHAAGLIA